MAKVGYWRRGPEALSQTERELDAEPAPLAIRKPKGPWDTVAALKDHRQLMDWYLLERERQSINRLQMAIDHDFYDGIQWADEDAEEVEARGQKAICYNELAPMVDWVIGTERRAKIDHKVLPRTEDDVILADAKTKLMKYVSDVNTGPFQRSLAFMEAVKSGVSFLECGIQTDPTKELLFNRKESWRRCLWDGAALEPDLEDGRYFFRWRWVDTDMLKVMMPDRLEAITSSASNEKVYLEEEIDEDHYYLGQRLTDRDAPQFGRRTYVADSATVGYRRERTKVIEAWYKKPLAVKRLYGHPALDGQDLDPKNAMQQAAINQGVVTVLDSVVMRMHVMLMTEKAVLRMAPCPYRHNRFPFTPIWCYRRGRDGAPYGMVRRVRDVQEDLNKRMSKALFNLSVNQILADEGASDDWVATRDEADAPDGVVLKKRGTELEIRTNADLGRGQLELAQFDVQKIQQTGGVNQDNLGRQTNAESGEAIKARQLQGAVTTTEPFDNQRYAVQKDGEKQLSLLEQFYSAPKVFRITGSRPGEFEWGKVNQPEIQPDGSVRFLNDITASQADFVVSEQDHHGTLRQAMFDAVNTTAQRMPDPNLALKLLRIAFEYSDLPNKQQIVGDIKQILGEPEISEPRNEEEARKLAELQARQQKAMQQQEQMAELAVEEQRAKVRHINAQASNLIAQVDEIRREGAEGGEEDPRVSELQSALQDAQASAQDLQVKAADETDKLVQQLAKLTAELNNRTFQVDRDSKSKDKDSDAKIRIAEIEKEGNIEVAKLTQKSDDKMQGVLKAVEGVAKNVEALSKELTEVRKGEKTDAEPTMVDEGGRVIAGPTATVKKAVAAVEGFKGDVDSIKKDVESVKDSLADAEKAAKEAAKAAEETQAAVKKIAAEQAEEKKKPKKPKRIAVKTPKGDTYIVDLAPDGKPTKPRKED